MNRAAVGILVLAGALAAAGIGWKIGRGAAETVPPPGPSAHPLSALPGRPLPEVSTDYTAVAQAPVAFRHGRPLDEIADDLRDSWQATELGADPTALALINELDADEIVALLPTLLARDPLPEALVTAALRRWAEFSPDEALAWADTHLETATFEDARSGILAAWAHRAPEEALAWLRAQWAVPARSHHKLETDFCALTYAWALDDPERALQAVLSQGKPGTYNIWWGFAHLVALDDRRDEAFGLLLGLDDETQRLKGIETAVGVWSEFDPAAAAAWLDSHGITDEQTQWSVVQRFSEADSLANATWLVARATPDTRDKAIDMALYQWARADPTAAGEWVRGLGPTDGAASQLANSWAKRDPAKALDWALAVKSADERAKVIGSVLWQIKSEAGEAFDPADYTEATGLDAERLTELATEAERTYGSRL